MQKVLAAVALLAPLAGQAQTIAPNTTIEIPACASGSYCPTTGEGGISLYGPSYNDGCPGGAYVWWPLVTSPQFMCAVTPYGTFKGTRTETVGSLNGGVTTVYGTLADSNGNTAIYQESFQIGCGRGCRGTGQGGFVTFNPE